MADRKDDVLIAENEAKNRINLVLKEKDEVLRQAKDKAKKELKSHDDELRIKTQDRITELHLNTNEIESIDSKTEVELKEIDALFSKNKDKVVNMLFDSVTKVNIVISNTVKENFERDFNY